MAEPYKQEATAGGLDKPMSQASIASAGAKLVTASTRKPRKLDVSGSFATPIYGRRTVRHFPISQSELKQLGERRNAGTIFSSAGMGLIGVGIGLLKDTVFTDKPKTVALPMMAQPPLVQDFNWTPISIAMIVGGLILLSVGIYSICAGKSLVRYIEGGTKFDGQEDSDI